MKSDSHAHLILETIRDQTYVEFQISQTCQPDKYSKWIFPRAFEQ